MAQLMPLPLTISCFGKIQIGFTFLVPATRVVPDKGPLNGCVHVHVCNNGKNVMWENAAMSSGPGNNTEENYGVFSLIWICWLYAGSKTSLQQRF